MIHFDHIQVSARNALKSARTLAEILGAPEPTPDGADDDMFRIDLDEGAFILIADAEEIHLTHFAIRVDSARFKEIVSRMKSKGLPFGNDHEDTHNAETSDPLGGEGRIYWKDEDGHLIEVAC